MASLLYGLHDRDAHPFVPAGGWIVESVALNENPQPPNYQAIRGDINWNIRLNWAHNGKDGTIPAPSQYPEFAKRCADYVAAQKGALHFSIGNEPQHAQEWVNGVKIEPEQYAECFNLCYAAIKKVRPDVSVAVAAVAPWNTQSGTDPIAYYKRMLAPIVACDALTQHGYTHGADPNLIWSDEMVSGWYWHFKIIYQTLEAVPGKFAMKPVHVTETNQGDEAWVDRNSGWVQNAYKAIDDYNHAGTSHPILSLALYRWRGDKYELHSKPQVMADFQKAVGRGYTSPVMGAQTMGNTTHIPVVSSGTSSEPTPALPPREWDDRLTVRGVTVETPPIAPGQAYWRIVKARWYDEQEADKLGPDHHIMADALDANGARVPGVNMQVKWPTGQHVIVTEAKPGEPYSANYPMSPSRNEFSIKVGPLGEPSEALVGIGMGAMTPSGYNAGIHTSTGVVFQLATMPQVSQPTPPTQPEPQPEPAPIPTPEEDHFDRAMAFVRAWEGGWADDPNDPGGATNKGITLGTYTRWRQAHGQPAPAKDDLRNITDAETNQIFREWYWQASGSDKLPWPLALAHFDTAVNAGVGRAEEMLEKSDGNFLAYMGHLIDWYTRIPNFEHFGRAWIRRRADILKEASET